MPDTSQSVTKPSDTGSVQQTTFSPYHSWSVGGRNHYFCSLQGVLRIIVIILVLIALIVFRGPVGYEIEFEARFIGSGASIFLIITLLMFTVSYLLGHLPPTLLEIMTTLVGAILMITAGALAVYQSSLDEEDGVRFSDKSVTRLTEDEYEYEYEFEYEDEDEDDGLWLPFGVISIIAGVVLAVDFILFLRTVKISSPSFSSFFHHYQLKTMPSTSDNGSVQQTVPGGITFSPYLSWSNHYLCSLQGILRIIEIILVLIALILLRVMLGSGTDVGFIVIGGIMFLTITLLMFTVSYLLGHRPPTLLEIMTTLVGALLMITAGALVFTWGSHWAIIAVGVTLIISGLVLAVDFILFLRTVKMSSPSFASFFRPPSNN